MVHIVELVTSLLITLTFSETITFRNICVALYGTFVRGSKNHEPEYKFKRIKVKVSDVRGVDKVCAIRLCNSLVN